MSKNGRFALAWHVLRGRPLIYRARFIRPILLDGISKGLKVVETQVAEAVVTKDGVRGSAVVSGEAYIGSSDGVVYRMET